MERTLVLVKPDAYERALVGEILSRFEQRGMRIVGLKVVRAQRQLLEKHYAEHEDKPFFGALVAMMREGPIVACIIEGDTLVVETARQLLGDFRHPAPGTIRGDYQTLPMYNIAHASSDEAAAIREIQLWFQPGELADAGALWAD